MNAPNARRVPKVVAGVLAMAASMTALATVVVSDFAEASSQPVAIYADELTPQVPVKVAKIEHKVVEDDLFLDEIAIPKPEKPRGRRRLNFGSFEGY